MKKCFAVLGLGLVLVACGDGTGPEGSGPPTNLAEFFYEANDNVGLRWRTGVRSSTEILLAVDGVSFEPYRSVAAGVDSVQFGRWCNAHAAAIWGVKHSAHPETTYLRGSATARVHVPCDALD